MDPLEITLGEANLIVAKDARDELRTGAYCIASTATGIAGMVCSDIPAVKITGGIIAVSSLIYGFYKTHRGLATITEFCDDTARYLQERHRLKLGGYELRLDN